jgi:hypothetical protein
MSKIDLRIRDLRTGDERSVAFESVEAARAWLLARPPFVEGLGVATHGLEPEVSLALKGAMRPLEEDERRAVAALDAARDEARATKEREERAVALVAAEAHKKAMREGDPNRPLQLHWTYDGGMTLTDAADPRPISDAARDALLAWIKERNEWVHDRGQIVGEVTAAVWPNAVPAGKDRVQQGSFFPVTAPAKTNGAGGS